MPQIMGPNYFRLPSLPMILLACGLMPLLLCVHAPEVIPYGSLGPIGRFLNYLAYDVPQYAAIVWYGIVVIHAMEAIYAFILSGQVGVEGLTRVAWFISTFIFGIGSLGILLKAKEKPSKHRL